MIAALRIAGKDLTLRIRDRSALIIGIAAPLTLAFIFNLIFGGAVTGSGLGLEYGVVDEDGSEIARAFVSVLEEAEEAGILELETFQVRSAAEASVERDDIDAYLAIPEGLESSVMAGRADVIEVVGSVNSPTSTQIAASFAEQFSSGLAAGQLAVTTVADFDGVDATPQFLAGLSHDPAVASRSFGFDDRSAETRQLDATTFFAAGMAAFFLFFTVQIGVTGLLDEERDGTMARLMAAPIPRASIIAGKGIVSFLLGVISMTVLVLATSLLMGADWGAPLGVAILVVAGVLSAVGVMGVVAAFARTPEGAGSLGSIVAVILGMLGGTFFPIGTTGGLLSNLTYLTPHAWFMRGLGDLGSGAPWTNSLPSAAAIMVFALATGIVAWVALRRRRLV